ncbi:phosphoribosylanthranilate isomerase [Exiguobacterium antarcticum]|uniref:N-(5'-phosphoribosyl)anthranilate isomerase n=1 Tax=Exiguobacterium antarcticum TaxID=132920 RepID=A0ABT6R3C4_9BACL|nr:phosphoribosylanthranilate isomerase [Exiguobacterium antarcticum]AFS70040.1 phosphoribosylanthranilate isomerase [Exiguobacterium antarcticum B7]MDI3235333.1 phosphoribosylanthranilate isomerase [Exiguobacterium antarcticum]
MTRIKFCGLKRIEEVKYAAERADYIGFVFAPSKRQVTRLEAAVLRKHIPVDVKVVGVFVSPTRKEVDETIEQVGLDLIQLHGPVSDELFRDQHVPIIQALPADATSSIHPDADYVLFDAPEAGSGQTFDWTTDLQADQPIFVAGGLRADNVQHVIERYHPFAVDVSSGIETNGQKDLKKMQAFTDAVKETFK